MLKWLARGPWFVAVFATLFHFFYFDNSCMYNFNLFGLAPCIYPINIQLKKKQNEKQKRNCSWQSQYFVINCPS